MSCKPTYKGVRYNSVEDLKSSIITPQQKQQALQKYSQYVEQTGNQDINGFKNFVDKKPTQLSMFNEEDFNEKLANFADLQPFEKQIIDENKDEDLDIQCKL